MALFAADGGRDAHGARMRRSFFSSLKLETRLGLLTGILFFVPLLFSSIYIGRFISHEQQAVHAESALQTALLVASSPLAARALAAAENDGPATKSLLAALLETARTRALHARSIVFRLPDGTLFHYPEPEEAASGPEPHDGVSLREERHPPATVSFKAPRLQTEFVPVQDSKGRFVGSLAIGFAADNMEYVISRISRPLQQMMLASMLLGLLLAVFMAKGIKKIMLGLEPEEIATRLQERNSMLQMMTEGVIALDSRGRVTLVNDEAARILRLAGIPAAPDSRTLAESPLVRQLARVLHSGEPELNDELNLSGITVLANHMPMTVDGRVVGTICTFRDMSEIRRLAERITDINRYVEALRSQSHEFLNKLHVIQGLVGNRSLTELDAYIEDLVSAKTREDETVHTAVKDPIIAGFLTSKYSNARELGATIVFDVQGTLPPIENASARNSLITILGNLIDNALDAMRDASEKTLRIGLAAHGNRLTVSVTDKGAGIAADEQPRIFSKNYSTKGEGRGLGLWLVMRSVDALNGTLGLHSEKGRGARFTVTLPLSAFTGDLHADRAHC